MRTLRYGYVWLGGGLVLGGVILYMALAPANRTFAVSFLSDKQAHGLAFFVLMTWFSGIFRLRFAPLIAVGLLLYGLLIEYLQSRLPYRVAEFADVIFDLAGILLGWALAAAGLGRWTVLVESWFSRTST